MDSAEKHESCSVSFADTFHFRERLTIRRPLAAGILSLALSGSLGQLPRGKPSRVPIVSFYPEDVSAFGLLCALMRIFSYKKPAAAGFFLNANG